MTAVGSVHPTLFVTQPVLTVACGLKFAASPSRSLVGVGTLQELAPAMVGIMQPGTAGTHHEPEFTVAYAS